MPSAAVALVKSCTAESCGFRGKTLQILHTASHLYLDTDANGELALTSAPDARGWQWVGDSLRSPDGQVEVPAEVHYKELPSVDINHYTRCAQHSGAVCPFTGTGHVYAFDWEIIVTLV